MRTYIELICRCQYCNYELDNIILKGGPIHKPYWLSWASFLCMAKMIINNVDSHTRVEVWPFFRSP